jgi:hypothetical protein
VISYEKSSRNTFISLCAIACLSALPAPCRAQHRTTPADSMRRAEQDMISREWNLTHIIDEADKKFKKEVISLFPQVQEDFRRLQIVNNEMMQTVFVAKSLDYMLISTSTEEIKRRALRLRQNLTLPRISRNEENHKFHEASGYEQLKASLLLLDHSIMSFVTNPLFKLPNVIDPKLAETATVDLESIIKLSDAVRKDAGKLSKSAKSAAVN